MSVLLNASAENYQRTSDLINHNAAYTVVMWVYPTANKWSTPWGTGNSGGNYDSVQLESGSPHWVMWVDDAVNDAGPTASLNTWYGLVIRRTGATGTNNFQCHIYSTSYSLIDTLQVTRDVSGRAATANMYIGRNGGYDDYFVGRVFNCKIWSADIGQAQGLQELKCLRPLRLANLYEAWPLFQGATRNQGLYKGRDWTENGSPGDAENYKLIPYGSPFYYINQPAAGGGPTAKDVSDALNMSLTDASTNLLSSAVSDALNVGITDAATLLGLLSVTDTLNISIPESAPTILSILGVSDGLSISLAESLANFLTSDVSDSLNVGITDASVVAVLLAVSDSISVGVTELADILTALAANDALNVAIAEGTVGLFITVDVSDAVGVSLPDASLNDLTSALVDALNISLADASALAALLTAADSVSIAITDSGVAEQVAEQISKSTSDTVSIQLAESVVLLIKSWPEEQSISKVWSSDVLLIKSWPEEQSISKVWSSEAADTAEWSEQSVGATPNWTEET